MAANPKDAMSPVDPTPIMQLSTAYWGSQMLFTAIRLGLFDFLGGGARSSADVARHFELDPRMTKLFLNACTGLGLLQRDGERFRNSRASEIFLTTASPASMKNSMRFMDDLYATWGHLEAALKSGNPAKTAETYLGTDKEQTRHFVYSMHDRALAIGSALPAIVNLTGRRRLLDVGGGPGTFSAMLTGRYEGLTADVLELPGVADVAEEILRDTGAAERVSMLRGDYHSSDFGSGYDVVLMSGMFHRESAANCRQLIRKAGAALDPGGLLVINDVFADADGTTPAFAALFGVTMMLTAPDGGVHADADVAAWMEEAGFTDVTTRPFPPPMPHRVLTGTRP